MSRTENLRETVLEQASAGDNLRTKNLNLEPIFIILWNLVRNQNSFKYN